MKDSRAASTDEIAAFRRFNRSYTRFIGTLNEGLLDSEFNLAEARVLYELATRETATAGEIAAELGLDAGYLSRMLGKFERDGLLSRTVSEQDGRYADLKLTAKGSAAFQRLNALSDEQARNILDDLPRASRLELTACMETIECLVASAGSDRSCKVERRGVRCALRTHRPGDMGWIVHREAIGYAEQYGWDESFEALVAGIVDQFLTNFDAARERCWIAEIGGRSAGHIFLVKHPEQPDTAKLRLLFVEPSARGMGMGDALVKECVQFARSAGYKKIVLWTQSILTGAHRIYERAGFRLVEEKPHHSFGKDLVGQTWELKLK